MAESESIWKKEIHFRRKPKPAPEPAREEPAAARPASESIWKKEISFRRKPKTVPAREPEPDEPAEETVAEETPVPAPPRGDYGWLTDEFDPDDVPREMPAIAPPPVSVPMPEPTVPPAESQERRQRRLAKPALPKVERPKLKRPALERKPKAKAPKQPKQPKAKAPKQPRPARARAPRGAQKDTIVGLKIGASQVTAARVANGATPQLVQVARETLPDGVVVAGELRDVEQLAATLKELFGRHKLPKRGVRLGIANNRIGVRTFELAGIDDPKQLANAIRFRAQETLPIPLEEAVLDWQILAERTDEESGQVVKRILLVVAYRELVDRYVDACRKAGIHLQGIDLEAFAMLRALGAPRSSDGAPPQGAQVVVNVGHDRSTFAVSDGRVCEFTRVLGWGGQSLSVAIARALDVTPSEATPLKHAVSLVATTLEPPEGVTPEVLESAREAVRRELQAFARELVSSLRFYQNQPGSLGIAEVVLTGGTAHLPGLADELQRLIGVPVRVGDPLNRVAVPKRFRSPDDCAVGSLTVAIGLGIED